MALPRAEDVLALPLDRVPEFIREHRSAKTLSVLVRKLNAALLDGDVAARDALDRLGLLEVA